MPTLDPPVPGNPRDPRWEARSASWRSGLLNSFFHRDLDPLMREDLAQKAMRRFLEKAHYLSLPEGEAKKTLFGIYKHAGLDLKRRRSRHPEQALGEENLAKPPADRDLDLALHQRRKH